MIFEIRKIYLSSYQVIKLSSHQSSHQVIKSSSHQVIKSSSHQVIKSSSHQVIKSSSHQVIKSWIKLFCSVYIFTFIGMKIIRKNIYLLRSINDLNCLYHYMERV